MALDDYLLQCRYTTPDLIFSLVNLRTLAFLNTLSLTSESWCQFIRLNKGHV